MIAVNPKASTAVGNITLIVHDCLIGFSGSNGSLNANPTITADAIAII